MMGTESGEIFLRAKECQCCPAAPEDAYSLQREHDPLETSSYVYFCVFTLLAPRTGREKLTVFLSYTAVVLCYSSPGKLILLYDEIGLQDIIWLLCLSGTIIPTDE